MLLVNDLPGVSARGVLSPSATQTGAADLTVIVERDPFEGMVGIDNYGSRYLGPVQATASASANSLLGLNEKITGQVVTTPMNGVHPELSYIGLNYLQPVFSYGTTIEAFGSKTLTSPGFDLKQFDVDGKSDLLGLTVRHPFIRSRELNLTGRTTFDYRNVDSENNLEPTREDRIRAFRVGGRLEAIDTLLSAAYNVFDLELAHGVDVLNSSQKGDFTSRADADPDFYKVSVEMQRLQRLTQSVNMLVGVTGQWANSPLYSAEEIGFGGISYGRGYDPSEILGDDGIGGKVELQWNEPYKISYLETYQLFGFYDVGKVFNKDATTSSQKVDSLASTGFGFRTTLPKAIDAGAMLAFPLTADPQTEDKDKARLLFTLSKKF
jgi:hemolysin activation/secretion protein